MPILPRSPRILLAVMALSTALVACGGGGNGGSDTSTINGHVASASTAATTRERSSWLARLMSPLGLVVGQAEAVGEDTSVAGIEVTATSGGNAASEVTNASGNFAIGDAPIGNVNVRFRRGGCSDETALPDVVAGGVVTFEDVDFDCSGVRPAKVSESFEAVVRNKPGSPNGNLNVCVTSGGGKRTRVVKIKNATFEDAGGGAASFDDLEDGSRIRAAGVREGLGTSSALDADLVTILGGVDNDDCIAQPTPTAEATETPEPTTTPTATP